MLLVVNDPKRLRETVRAACSECANETVHDILAAVDEDHSDPEVPAGIPYFIESHEIIRCRGCNRVSFRKNWESSEDIDYEKDQYGAVLVQHPELYPPRLRGRGKIAQKFQALPSRVCTIYSEVHQALCSGQTVLTGIGIRALVEAVCAERNARGRNLEQRIDDLVSTGVLSKDGAQVLHGIRLLGNQAAHEVQPPTEQQLSAAMDVAEHLLDAVYILPSAAASLPRPKPKRRSGPGSAPSSL